MQDGGTRYIPAINVDQGVGQQDTDASQISAVDCTPQRKIPLPD